MNKKTISLIILLMLGLAACGTAASRSMEEVSVGAPAYDQVGEGLGYDESQSMPTTAPYPVVKNDTLSVEPAQERMVIMNADLTIVILDPQAKAEAISALAERLGGFVVSMSMYQTTLYDGGTAPEGYISIRIPAGKLNEALEEIKADAVEVRNENHTSQDVTAEYVDLQSRLNALEAARDKLETIMDAAEKTEDVLNVFNQLQYYNEQIEVVKGQIKYYEETTAYSLITVSLLAEETIQPLVIGPWTPGEAARNAIQGLINFMQDFVDFLVYFFLLVIPILLVIFGPIALVVWLIVRGVKRRKAKQAAAAK